MAAQESAAHQRAEQLRSQLRQEAETHAAKAQVGHLAAHINVDRGHFPMHCTHMQYRPNGVLSYCRNSFSTHVSRFAPQSSGHLTPNKSLSSPRWVKPVSALHHVISWYSIMQILLSLFGYSLDGCRSLWCCSNARGASGPYPQRKLKREPATLQPDIHLACLPILLQVFVIIVIVICVGPGGA